MDLQSLQAEIRKQNIPPLVKDWENDKLFELFRMYEKKCSLETMALHFGKTRGQVSGLLHRAVEKGLLSRHKPKIKAQVVVKELRTKPTIEAFNIKKVVQRLNKIASKQRSTGSALKKRRVRLRLITDEHQVTFAELQPHHCRWPIGDPRRPDFRFCGCNKFDPKKPYCEGHLIAAGRLYDQPKK